MVCNCTSEVVNVGWRSLRNPWRDTGSVRRLRCSVLRKLLLGDKTVRVVTQVPLTGTQLQNPHPVLQDVLEIVAKTTRLKGLDRNSKQGCS